MLRCDTSLTPSPFSSHHYYEMKTISKSVNTEKWIYFIYVLCCHNVNKLECKYLTFGWHKHKSESLGNQHRFILWMSKKMYWIRSCQKLYLCPAADKPNICKKKCEKLFQYYHAISRVWKSNFAAFNVFVQINPKLLTHCNKKIFWQA